MDKGSCGKLLSHEPPGTADRHARWRESQKARIGIHLPSALVNIVVAYTNRCFQGRNGPSLAFGGWRSTPDALLALPDGRVVFPVGQGIGIWSHACGAHYFHAAQQPTGLILLPDGRFVSYAASVQICVWKLLQDNVAQRTLISIRDDVDDIYDLDEPEPPLPSQTVKLQGTRDYKKMVVVNGLIEEYGRVKVLSIIHVACSTIAVADIHGLSLIDVDKHIAVQRWRLNNNNSCDRYISLHVLPSTDDVLRILYLFPGGLAFLINGNGGIDETILPYIYGAVPLEGAMSVVICAETSCRLWDPNQLPIPTKILRGEDGNISPASCWGRDSLWTLGDGRVVSRKAALGAHELPENKRTGAPTEVMKAVLPGVVALHRETVPDRRAAFADGEVVCITGSGDLVVWSPDIECVRLEIPTCVAYINVVGIGGGRIVAQTDKGALHVYE